MAKRFFSTEKFNDPWYRKLNPVQKCLWEYVLCQCDFAGIWNVDIEAASFHIGGKIEQADLDAFKDRFVWLSDELVFIPKFIHFQYGELIGANKAHQGVIKRLEQFNIPLDRGYVGAIKELVKGYQGASLGDDRSYIAPKEKEKEKDKENRKGVQGENKNGCRFENSTLFSETIPEVFLQEAVRLKKQHIASTQYDKFKDYWKSKTGQNATKLDWVATWRNWLRDAKETGGLGTPYIAPDAGRHHSREEMEAFLGRKMEIFDVEGENNEFTV